MRLKGKALPSDLRVLNHTGVPWVIIKPTKQYKIARPSSVARVSNQNEPPLLSIPSNKGSQSSQTTERSVNIKNRFPFLDKTSIDLNDEDLITINESLNRDTKAQLSINTPSRLQQIKLSRFESAQKPLALDVNPSEPFIVSTAPDNIPADLERDNSLISINCEEDISDQIQMKSSITSRAPTSADLSEMSREVSMTSRHQPVSLKEVRNQIWVYCHSNESQKKPTHLIKTQLIDTKIESNTSKVVINQPAGRKRLINIIHKVADDSKADQCEKVPEMKIDKPIENTFTARSFSRYLYNQNIDVPSYLSPSEKVL